MEMISENEEKKNLIFGKYRLTKIIGSGSFGYVYEGINVTDNKGVAVKVEKKDNGLNLLEKESFYLYSLKGIGLPEVISFGYSGKYNILVQTLLGESLGKIFYKNNNYFSLKDICMFSIQILHRIEYVHSKYIIHRDIKPENFLIGEPDKYMIYIIDFGLSKKYKSSRTNKHVQFRLTKKFTGTARYASINAVRGAEQSRRDDLEAIGYMLLFFFNGGRLPWQGISCKAKAEKYIKIYNMKKNLNFEQFCQNMPKEIITYMNYCRDLEFEQKPDYDYLRSLFENALKYKGISNDLHFSWIKDLSILNKYDNKIVQTSIGRRKASPQSRIYKKLENSREVTKEKENENEDTFSKNNLLKKIDNIVVLKPKSNSPQYIIHKRFNSSGDNVLKKSKDSDNYKSGIAQYNLSIDEDEQMTDKTSNSKKGEAYIKVKDILNVNRDISNNNIIMNNNNLYYFSGNIKDLSKSLVLKNNNETKMNESGLEQNNGNNYQIRKQNSSFFIHNRVFSSNAINKSQNQNQNINLVSPNIIKSFSFIKKNKPIKEETKDIKENVNSKENFNNQNIPNNFSTQNIYNNNKNNNNNNNNNDNINKKNVYNFKNKFHNLKINNNIKKQNTNIIINRSKNNIYINFNGLSNNNSKKKINSIKKSKQIDTSYHMKNKKSENNTVRKNKKRKIVKMKVKNIPNISNTSLNNLNCKSAANILKKYTTPNNLQQNLKFSIDQYAHNSNLKKENIIKTQNNIVNNFGNNIEGKINKVKSMNIHSNTQKNNIQNNYKKITTNQIFKNNANTNKNSNHNNINFDILNLNQSRINKYKNLRHKAANKINEFPVQKSLTRIKETSKQKQRTSHGTVTNTINNCNTVNNTINSNNNNNTIISIYNNYNLQKDNKIYGFIHKKLDNINIALDTLNNINKEKSKNNYYSYNGYKIKLNSYKNYIHLNQKKNTILHNMPSINNLSNYTTLNSKLKNDSNLYNSQILLNKDYSLKGNDSKNNSKNYFSLNNQDNNLIKLKQNKVMHLSSSRPNLNSYKIKKIFNEFNQEHPKVKKMERNNTQYYMDLNLFGFNKIKMEKNNNSLNLPRSKSFIYGVNYINNNNKMKSQEMDLNFNRPSTNRKNTDIFVRGNYNIYKSKLKDENKNFDSIFKKKIRAQSRDYYNYDNNIEKDKFNILF